MTRASSVERGQRPEHSKLEGGHRKLPSRPFTRMSSFESRDTHVPRRGPLLRNNSGLHRKMSYRQHNNSGDSFHYNSSGSHVSSAATHHRNFRRYGPQTEVERRAVLALIAREREAQMAAHMQQPVQSADNYLQSDLRGEGGYNYFQVPISYPFSIN